MKRTIIRAAIVAAWFLLGILIFITSRGHTLLLDNRDIQGPDGTPQTRAPEQLTVFVDTHKGVELLRGDRDLLTVTGSKHRVRVEFADGSPPFEGNFVLPIKNDMYLLAVAGMINGAEPFVEVFRSAPEPRNAGDESADETEGSGEAAF